MHKFFELVGICTCAGILAITLFSGWILFVTPLIKACSLIRFFMAHMRKNGFPRPVLLATIKEICFYWKDFFLEEGTSFTLEDGSNWKGVGKWTLK